MPDLKEVHWESSSPKEKISAARQQARKLRMTGNLPASHSVMLSARYGILTSGNKSFKIFAPAILNAWVMYYHRLKLNHNELDVLLKFLLAVRKRVEWFRIFVSNTQLVSLSHLAFTKITESKLKKPHQEALAHITNAEVLAFTGPVSNWSTIKANLEFALNLEDEIKKEKGQPQGLRQLVRIWKNAGQLFITVGDIGGRRRGFALLNKALALADGDAKSSDQAAKILRLIKELEFHKL